MEFEPDLLLHDAKATMAQKAKIIFFIYLFFKYVRQQIYVLEFYKNIQKFKIYLRPFQGQKINNYIPLHCLTAFISSNQIS